MLYKYKISGHSMFPTLRDGQIILVNRLVFLLKKPKVNDIVAVKKEHKVFIKRITKIEKNTYFLSGDNPADSMDSRRFGMIERKDIIGKVMNLNF